MHTSRFNLPVQLPSWMLRVWLFGLLHNNNNNNSRYPSIGSHFAYFLLNLLNIGQKSVSMLIKPMQKRRHMCLSRFKLSVLLPIELPRLWLLVLHWYHMYRLQLQCVPNLCSLGLLQHECLPKRRPLQSKLCAFV